MTLDELSQRLVALERQVEDLRANVAGRSRVKDWRRTIGVSAGDEIMKRIDEEARKFREADRQRARRRQPKQAKAKPKAGAAAARA